MDMIKVSMIDIAGDVLLTVETPRRIRSTYTKTTEVRAHTGKRSVQIEAMNIPIPNTRLPPNLSDSHPAGI